MMRRTNDGTYLFDSATTPGKFYTVEYVETASGWALACSCPGFVYTGKCWHCRAVRAEEAARHLGSAA